MKSLQEHLTGVLESNTPKSKQKTPCVYKGRTITYRPGLSPDREWNEFSKSHKYGEIYDEATFAFNYDTNTLEVECPNWRATRMAHYNFKLKSSSFEEYNIKNMDITPQDFNFYNQRGDLTQMIDVLNIACWVFNNSPEPLFDE
jgi:hypothetical protein